MTKKLEIHPTDLLHMPACLVAVAEEAESSDKPASPPPSGTVEGRRWPFEVPFVAVEAEVEVAVEELACLEEAGEARVGEAGAFVKGQLSSGGGCCVPTGPPAPVPSPAARPEWLALGDCCAPAPEVEDDACRLALTGWKAWFSLKVGVWNPEGLMKGC